MSKRTGLSETMTGSWDTLVKLAQNKRAERERNPVYFLRGPIPVETVLHVCIILKLEIPPVTSLLVSSLPEM